MLTLAAIFFSIFYCGSCNHGEGALEVFFFWGGVNAVKREALEVFFFKKKNHHNIVKTLERDFWERKFLLILPHTYFESFFFTVTTIFNHNIASRESHPLSH